MSSIKMMTMLGGFAGTPAAKPLTVNEARARSAAGIGAFMGSDLGPGHSEEFIHQANIDGREEHFVAPVGTRLPLHQSAVGGFHFLKQELFTVFRASQRSLGQTAAATPVAEETRSRKRRRRR